MKVVKEMHHGLLLNYFGLKDKYYASFTVMTFFGFDDPDNAISEQEMWPFIQGELGKETIFDMAMPKPRGEVFIHGRCFAPDGKPRPAAQVSFQMGALAKTLDIFGNRFWKLAGGALQVISDPEPFTEMPITYAQAFGGKGFDRNPLGKGFAPLLSPSGDEILPLPNIEDPQRLIGSPSDRPGPAGFGPLDFTWPQRAKKLGTYDDKWFRERWPFYPEDIDWTFFNAAPDDQQQEGFFRGAETFIVKNMHPAKPLVQSRLPALRQRCFINQSTDLKKKDSENIFREVTTRLETVWIFPHAERGIAVYRGTAEVADDEALDVRQLFLATEGLEEQPRTIEHYLEELKKRLDRSVPAEMAAPLAEAKEKLNEMKEGLQDLPLQVKDSIAQGLGRAPQPVRTPKEIVAQSLRQIDRQGKQLDEAEQGLLAMKSQYGHLAKIDLGGFERGRQGLADAKTKLQALNGKIDEVHEKIGKAQDKMKDQLKGLKGKMPPALLGQHGLDDPDKLFEPFQMGPQHLWHDMGMRFIEACRDNLRENHDVYGRLRSLGLRPYTIKRHWLGLNTEIQEHDPAHWGLKKKESASHLLPAGLIIPRFDGATLDKITVRPGGGTDPSADLLIEGSKDAPLVLGAGEGKPWVRVADELEAVLLHQELGDFCTIIAMANPDKRPDKGGSALLKDAPQFLVVRYPESREPGDCDAELWKKIHPLAEPLPLPSGKNLFAAKKDGIDLWQWVADALRPGISPEPALRPKDVDINEPGALASLIPVFDVAAIVEEVKDAIMGRVQPKLDLMEVKKKENMDALRKVLAGKGVNLDELMKQPAGKSILQEANPYAAAQGKYEKMFATVRRQLQEKKMLTPEVGQKLAEAEKTNQALLSQAASQYEQGMAKLEAAKAQFKGGFPEWSKPLFAQMGIDPEDPAPLRQWTREEVVERYGAGKSLAGKNLSGVDLSGLSLPGIDLKKAHLQKAKLNGCHLDGADLSGAIANEADFSRASLKEAKMGKGLFQKAKFVEAKLQLADLTQAVMSEADLSGADLTGAQLEMALLEKANLAKAKLTDAKAKQGYFLSADVSQANFSGADISKAIFLKANIDQVDFSGGTLRGTIFIEAKGGKLNLSGADMHNSRIINDSALTDSDFTDVKAERACWLRSDLSGSDFRKSDLKRGLLEECNLAGANLSGVSAKQARLTKCDLSDANLLGMNMLFGSLRKTKLVRTDLRRANLYGVEFYRTGVGETKFEEANLKMTKLDRRTALIPGSKTEKKA